MQQQPKERSKGVCRHQGQWRKMENRYYRHWERDSAAVDVADCGEAAVSRWMHKGWWWPHGKPVLWRSPGRAHGLWERGPHALTDLLQDLGPHQGSTPERSIPAGMHPMEGAHAGAICEELQLVWRTNTEEVYGGLSPMGGNFWWSRGRLWGVLLLKRKE